MVDPKELEAFFRMLSDWKNRGKNPTNEQIVNSTSLLDRILKEHLCPAVIRRLPANMQPYYMENREEALSVLAQVLWEVRFVYKQQEGVGGAINYFATAARWKLIAEFEKQFSPEPSPPPPLLPLDPIGPITLELDRMLHHPSSPLLLKKQIVILLLKVKAYSGEEIVELLSGGETKASKSEWDAIFEFYFPYNTQKLEWATVISWFKVPPPRLSRELIDRNFRRVLTLLKQRFQ